MSGGAVERLEAVLIEGMRMMLALPDRERGFLSAGSRSGWPDIVRQVRAGEYDARGGDGTSSDVPLRTMALSRRQFAMVEALFLAPDALAMAVPSRDRALVGRVLIAKGGRLAGGFRWSMIWQAMGGRACGVTSDALRMRYERALERHMLRRVRCYPLVADQVFGRGLAA